MLSRVDARQTACHATGRFAKQDFRMPQHASVRSRCFTDTTPPVIAEAPVKRAAHVERASRLAVEPGRQTADPRRVTRLEGLAIRWRWRMDVAVGRPALSRRPNPRRPSRTRDPEEQGRRRRRRRSQVRVRRGTEPPHRRQRSACACGTAWAPGSTVREQRRTCKPKNRPATKRRAYAASSGPSTRFRLTASVRTNRFGRGIAMAAAYGGPSPPPLAS